MQTENGCSYEICLCLNLVVVIEILGREKGLISDAMHCKIASCKLQGMLLRILMKSIRLIPPQS